MKPYVYILSVLFLFLIDTSKANDIKVQHAVTSVSKSINNPNDQLKVTLTLSQQLFNLPNNSFKCKLYFSLDTILNTSSTITDRRDVSRDIELVGSTGYFTNTNAIFFEYSSVFSVAPNSKTFINPFNKLYLIIVADSDNMVQETNELNNVTYHEYLPDVSASCQFTLTSSIDSKNNAFNISCYFNSTTSSELKPNDISRIRIHLDVFLSKDQTPSVDDIPLTKYTSELLSDYSGSVVFQSNKFFPCNTNFLQPLKYDPTKIPNGTYYLIIFPSIQGTQVPQSISSLFFPISPYFLSYMVPSNKYTFPTVVTSLFDDVVNEEFSVYPNPTTSDIEISSSDEGSVKIFDAQGNEVYSSSSLTTNHHVVLTGLATGMYVVEHTSAGKVSRKKLVRY